MSWKNIRLILQREVRDQLRDRRTLFMIVVLPLLLYPGLAIGMVQASFLFREQSRTVVVLGADNLPKHPPLLKDDHFAEKWFSHPDDVNKLLVISDAAGQQTNDEANELLKEARALQPQIEQLAALQRSDKPDRHDDALAERLRALKDDLAERFSATKIQVLLVVPRGLAAEIERTNLALDRRGKTQEGAKTPLAAVQPLVVQNSADEKSMFAYQRVKQVLASWEQEILEERLTEAKLPPTLATPVNALPIDLAMAKQLSANLWSKLFPTLLIIMAVTGAFYPAVDVAAGEKERGTMETLLICPARRGEIVLGKFFTVLAFSVSTVLLNLVSMGITGKYLIGAARSDALAKIGAGGLSFPGPWEMLWLVVLLLPLSAFFSSVSLALATFARSTKEGQYYLTPLLVVTLGLTLFCLSPAVEIEPFYSILPVVGPALLLKDVLATSGSTAPLVYGIPVLVSSIAYSLAGLWWAITMFNREDVLFREAERFNIRLWIRHLLRDKEPTPSSAEAVLCFVLVLLLQFVAVRFMRGGTVNADGSIDPPRMMQLLIVQQMVLVACPALFMGIMLTTSVARTFRLRLPDWRYAALGCLLPLVVHPISVALQTWLQGWFFPPLPKEIEQLMSAVSSQNLPVWVVIAAMAAAPAICEETAYRGFILSGFLRSARPGVAIMLSAVAFGITHMIPQQVFNATLLGLLLGLLAVRSRSIFVGMLFHLIYNSVEVLRDRYPWIESWVITSTAKDPGVMQFRMPALVIAVIAASIMIAWLIRGEGKRREPADASDRSRERQQVQSTSAGPPVHTT